MRKCELLFAAVLSLLVVPVLSAQTSCPSTVPSGVTKCYFIDYASGSDANPGTSESAPWQHAPSMANASGTAAAHSPSAGEGWIFKGGVTVDSHAWPMDVPWNGSSGNPTYIGYDSGWYAGTSWARPIFSGGGSSGFNSAGSSMVTNNHSANNFILDNIEFTGLYWTSACSGSGCGYVYGGTGASNWEMKNVYAHGWSHCSASSGCTDPGGGPGLLFAGGEGSSIHDTIIDGADSSQDCCSGASAPVNYNNYYAYLVDDGPYAGAGSNVQDLHNSTITHNVSSFTGGPHPNCIHWFGEPQNSTIVLYNNYISCQWATPTYVTQAVLLDPNPGSQNLNYYIFNNIIQSGTSQGFNLDTYTPSQGASYWWIFNNTFEGGYTDSNPQYTLYTVATNVNLVGADNFLISKMSAAPVVYYTSTNPWTGVTSFPSPTFSLTCSGGGSGSNFGASAICAPIGTGNGTGNINSSETYPFAPLDATAAATIGTGQNNSSYCTALAASNAANAAAASTACLSDTTAGVAYNTSNHTVSPARVAVPRPTGGAWRNGAYEYASGTGSSSAVNPPTGLTAAVQ